MRTRFSLRAPIAVAAIAMLPLVACAPGEDDDGGSEPPVEASDVETDIASMGDVTLTVWDQEVRGGQDKPIKELNAEFEEKYPNVKIERVSRSFDDLQKQVRLAISGGDAPDVVQANNARADMGAFVKAGLLRPLDGYADVYGWTERFPESVRSVASYSEDGQTFGEGNLYGVPLTGELVGVWYNKAKLEQLGIEPPQTAADFEAALQTAKDAGEIPIQFGNLDQWPGIHTWGFVQNLNAPREEIVQLGFGQPGASWESEGNQAAAETLATWVDQGYFTEGFNGLGYDPAWQKYIEGQGVFLVSGTWLQTDLEAGLGEDLGFMLPPVGDSGELAVTGSTGLPFAITAAADEPDVAAAYLDFITSPDAMTKISEAGSLPAHDTAAQSPEGALADVFAAWDTAISEDALTPYLDWATPDATDVVPTEVQRFMGGETSSEEFLGALEDDYTSFTE
jgi:raffinose/stachyose/melibiose transport system substrate-binding protein